MPGSNSVCVRTVTVMVGPKFQVHEQLRELTQHIDEIQKLRMSTSQETRAAESFGLGGTPPIAHSEDEFQSLVTKMQAKRAEPSTSAQPQQVIVPCPPGGSCRAPRGGQATRGDTCIKGSIGPDGSPCRAPRAQYAGAGKYRAALQDAGYNLREANRLLLLEAWDIIHRGSYGYPGASSRKTKQNFNLDGSGKLKIIFKPILIYIPSFPSALLHFLQLALPTLIPRGKFVFLLEFFSHTYQKHDTKAGMTPTTAYMSTHGLSFWKTARIWSAVSLTRTPHRLRSYCIYIYVYVYIYIYIYVYIYIYT